MIHRARSLVSRWEEPGAGWIEYGLFFLTVTLLRGVLEGLLERDHLLGARAIPGVSQAMLFAHFPAFYGAAFLLVVLVLCGFSRRKPAQVIPLVLRFWPIILTPPLIDAVISGGRGYAMSYLFSPGQMTDAVLFFWRPSLVSTAGVTPGMRLEIVLVCIGATAYAALWRGPLRGVCAGLMVFVCLLLLGSVPALGGLVGSNGDWIQTGGFGNLQSHRFALANLYLLIPLALAVWRLHDPGQTRAYLVSFRWLRSLMYVVLTSLGCWIVYIVSAPWIGTAFRNPGDWLSVAGVLLAELLCFQAACLWNDMADAPWDTDSGKQRFLLHPGIATEHAKRLGAFLACVGLLMALCVQYAVFLVVLVQLGVAWVYSWPPLRLKRFPVVSTAVVAGAAVLAVVAGGAMVAREWVFSTLPLRFLLGLFISFLLAFGVKDIPDAVSDRKGGVRTVPVLLGKRRASLVLAAGVLLGFVVFPLLSGLESLLLPGFVMGMIAAVVVCMARWWSEKVLLILLLLALAMIGIAAYRDSEWLATQRKTVAGPCADAEGEEMSPPDRMFAVLQFCGSEDPRRIEALTHCAMLSGQYPWLLPEVARCLRPEESSVLLGDIAEAAICPGVAHAARLDPLAVLGRQDEWCMSLQGALVLGRETASLLAVSARHADQLGLVGRAMSLLRHGVDTWPDDPAVWGEMAGFLFRRDDLSGALGAARRAAVLDPMSAVLKRDIERIEELMLSGETRERERTREERMNEEPGRVR